MLSADRIFISGLGTLHGFLVHIYGFWGRFAFQTWYMPSCLLQPSYSHNSNNLTPHCFPFLFQSYIWDPFHNDFNCLCCTQRPGHCILLRCHRLKLDLHNLQLTSLNAARHCCIVVYHVCDIPSVSFSPRQWGKSENQNPFWAAIHG